jgi:hypothetical protein
MHIYLIRHPEPLESHGLCYGRGLGSVHRIDVVERATAGGLAP